MSHRRATPRPARRSRRARPLSPSALALLGMAAGFALAPSIAVAAAPVQQTQLIRFGTESGSVIGDGYGVDAGAVALGDVNGDGRDDFGVRGRAGQPLRAVVRVVFGSPTDRYPTLDALGSAGFTIRSTTPWSDQLELGTARDFDGDGLRDVLVSDSTGLAVVYGDRSGGDVDISVAGPRVTRLDAQGGRVAGTESIGDFDGDGHDDLVSAGGGTATVNGNAIVLGGPRTATIPVRSGPRSVRIPAPKSCSTTFWYWFIPVCQYPADAVVPIGDSTATARPT